MKVSKKFKQNGKFVNYKYVKAYSNDLYWRNLTNNGVIYVLTKLRC